MSRKAKLQTLSITEFLKLGSISNNLYFVNDNDEMVSLDARIKPAGLTILFNVKLSSNLLNLQPNDVSFKKFGIGLNKNLPGEGLKILCAVNNTTGKTAKAKMIFFLQGGEEVVEYTTDEQTLEIGDSHVFEKEILFAIK